MDKILVTVNIIVTLFKEVVVTVNIIVTLIKEVLFKEVYMVCCPTLEVWASCSWLTSLSQI